MKTLGAPSGIGMSGPILNLRGALAKMESQFRQRVFTKNGEILHVLGLHLFLSDRRILPGSRADVIAQGKKYIDDVYAAKTLENSVV